MAFLYSVNSQHIVGYIRGAVMIDCGQQTLVSPPSSEFMQCLQLSIYYADDRKNIIFGTNADVTFLPICTQVNIRTLVAC